MKKERGSTVDRERGREGGVSKQVCRDIHAWWQMDLRVWLVSCVHHSGSSSTQTHTLCIMVFIVHSAFTLFECVCYCEHRAHCTQMVLIQCTGMCYSPHTEAETHSRYTLFHHSDFHANVVRIWSIYLYLSIYLSVCLYICLSVYIYIYIYTYSSLKWIKTFHQSCPKP